MSSSSAGGNSSARNSVPADPPDFLTQQRLRLAFQLAPEEMQLHRPFRVLVRDLEQLRADDGIASELFAQLADETAFVGLAVLALAAGKLPQPFEVRATQPSRDEIGAASFNDRGRDDDAPVSHVRCQG